MADQGELLSTYLGILPQAPEAGVLRLLIEIGAQVVGAGEGSLLVLDEEEGDLRFAMTVGSEESEKALLGQRVPLGEGITGLAAASLEVQIGAPTYMDVKQAEKAAGPGEPEAVLAAPMTIGDRLVGVITAVSFAEGKRFTSEDARLYAGIAGIAGVVVDQRRRLASVESEAAERGPEPRALGEAARLEREILERIGRLVKHRPDSLPQVASLLRNVESMVLPEEASGS
jgi:GAF domain-containing protein